MTFRRPNYRDSLNCPGWAGSGWTETTSTDCDGHGRKGEIIVIVWLNDLSSRSGVYRTPAGSPFRVGECDVCDIRTLPYAVKWLEPATYRRILGPLVYRILHPRKYHTARLIDAATK